MIFSSFRSLASDGTRYVKDEILLGLVCFKWSALQKTGGLCACLGGKAKGEKRKGNISLLGSDSLAQQSYIARPSFSQMKS